MRVTEDEVAGLVRSRWGDLLAEIGDGAVDRYAEGVPAPKRAFAAAGSALPTDTMRPAVHAPVRSLAAFFQRPLFVFDACRTVTRAHHAQQSGRTVFRHDIGHTGTPRTASLRVWELLDAT